MIPLKLIYRTYLNPIRLKSSSKTNGSTQRDEAPLPRKMGLFPVYRLEEAEGLLKEGGVRFSGAKVRKLWDITTPFSHFNIVRNYSGQSSEELSQKSCGH